MDITIFKKLIDDQLLDFSKMVLKYYKQVGLIEIEAMVLLELESQKSQGNTFLNPSKIGKNMSIPKEELLGILDRLMKKGYLSIQIKKMKSGKETETFDMDDTIRKILNYIENQIREDFINLPSNFSSPQEEVASLIESQFQKQLKPLEVEMIQKWLNEDQYVLLEIKRALLDAYQANRFSMSYVDSILLKRKNMSSKKEEVVYKTEKSEALKSFYNSWEQK